ncbi:hypothetical protein CVT24_001174 [Panaeolus cyanescens]|uniref:hAT-like transposase RNase-H fold domain-containing protein n=1 Tax=Panaeolus cyanescens TaxID=181874 RepID=A0A409YZ50_9AGAR|nr:hypothetical protein CVT24_001174 [Panaeolus cyanescens]
MSIIDRLHIPIEKIGWITLDNASNNDMMMVALEKLLGSQGVLFSANDQCVRCFPHIVNLTVQSILSAITNLNYASDNSQDFMPDGQQHQDLIAMLQTLINKIRASSLCCEQFAKIQESLSPSRDVLQLIQDVSTRWSSTHLMIHCALELRKAINKYVLSNTDLYQYCLTDSDWKILEVYAKILAVSSTCLPSEATPILCDALPSFKRMLAVWTNYQTSMPAYSSIIEAGITKLLDYYSKIVNIPAFQLSICAFFLSHVIPSFDSLYISAKPEAEASVVQGK